MLKVTHAAAALAEAEAALSLGCKALRKLQEREEHDRQARFRSPPAFSPWRAFRLSGAADREVRAQHQATLQNCRDAMVLLRAQIRRNGEVVTAVSATIRRPEDPGESSSGPSAAVPG
jgi:hypothetical protein